MRRLGVIAVVLFGVPNAAFGATFIVSGHGWGHGVGMSQWGAEGLAMHGWGYSRILDHYYPGTSLGREQGAAVRVLLADGRRRVTISSRSRFRRADVRARDEQSRLDLRPLRRYARPDVRRHPRREAVHEPRGRRDVGPGRDVERRARADVLLVDLGWTHGIGERRVGRIAPISA